MQRLTGDERGNVNPGILSLHGLLVKEHNRLCDELVQSNPVWSDERVFQEARKRVSAIMQSITMNEYYPTLLGEAPGEYPGYDPSANAQISLFFITASYRYGHSAINSIYQRIEPNGGCPLQVVVGINVVI